MFYRLFFWGFVGGTMRDPGGIQYVLCLCRQMNGQHSTPRPRSPASAAFFVNIIVKAPVVQIMTFLLGLFLIALEYPVPILKELAIHRSLMLRFLLLMTQAVLTILFYQVSIYYLRV